MITPIVTPIEKEFIEKHKEQLIASKYVAKKLLMIKQNIEARLGLPQEPYQCFCGGEPEQRQFMSKFYEWIKTIED